MRLFSVALTEWITCKIAADGIILERGGFIRSEFSQNGSLWIARPVFYVFSDDRKSKTKRELREDGRIFRNVTQTNLKMMRVGK